MKAKKLFLVLGFLLIASSSFAAENAILVTQPAYHYMRFYVYKPANLPREFYATFDGYLVYKNEKGIWQYASYDKGSITKTGYVVGSVIPSVVRLKPYNAKISSTAPILKSNPEPAKPAVSPRIIYTPPADIENESPERISWSTNANFMAISKWQGTVDRVGILNRPKMPVAWKGDHPEVIYAWTGAKWKEIFPRDKNTSVITTLRRALYSLTVEKNKTNRLHWYDEDNQALGQYAYSWGYEWLGVINLGE